MAKFNEEKMAALARISKNLLRTHQLYARKRTAMLDPVMTKKRRDKLRNQVETDAEYIEGRLHELHCLAVELGIAALEPHRYGEKEIQSSNGWNRLKVLRRHPVVP